MLTFITVFIRLIPVLLSGLGYLVCDGVMQPNDRLNFLVGSADAETSPQWVSILILVAGYFFPTIFPKSKDWLEKIKAMFGVVDESVKLEWSAVIERLLFIKRFAVQENCDELLEKAVELEQGCFELKIKQQKELEEKKKLANA